jgi:polyisoprenoid-binding protein YceI
MKNTLNKYPLLRFVPLLILFIGLAPLSDAQTPYKIGGKPVMTLYGTSTMHDWTMTANVFTANAQITLSSDNQLTGFNALNVTLPIENLKSEHDGMNSNAYETLKSDKFPNIIFALKAATVTASGENKYQIAALGSLSIAGVSKTVTLNATAQVNANGSVSCSGTVPLKLSDFNIERPSFMLGTMKVGDALTLNYALVFVK